MKRQSERLLNTAYDIQLFPPGCLLHLFYLFIYCSSDWGKQRKLCQFHFLCLSDFSVTFHFLSFTLLCCSVPFRSVLMLFFFLLSPQVAIKIIDKTQLNPNSLQKVIYPPSHLSPLSRTLTLWQKSWITNS